MNPKLIAIAIHTQTPLYIHGKPGGGKSSLARQVIDATNHSYKDIRGAGLDVGDMHIPMPDHEAKTLRWWINADLPTEPRSVILLDDASQMPPAVWNIWSEIILDRTFHEWRAPADMAIIATGNLKADRAATSPVPTHILNRFMHVYYETTPQSFLDYNRNPDALPDVTLPDVPVLTSLHPDLLAFFRFRPNLIHAFDANVNACPTPRSNMMFNRLYPYFQAMPDLRYDLANGCCGESFANDVIAFTTLLAEMPNPLQALSSPTTTPIVPPDKPGIQYALMGALGEHVTLSTAANLFTYLERVNTPEMELIAVQDAKKRIPTILTSCSQGTKWAVKNAAYLMGA